MTDPDSGAIATLTAAMAGLRDLAQVHGSFLVSARGELVARDIAPYFGDDVLGEVAVRMLRLTDVFTTEHTSVQSFVVRFRDCLLFVRNIGQGALCVLSAPDVNMPALRMGTNLVSRRITRMANDHSPTPTPTLVTPMPPMQPTQPTPPAPAAPAAIRWRGSIVPKSTR